MTFANTFKLALAAAIALPAVAFADDNGPDSARLAEAKKLGVLECSVAGGFGLLVGSSKKADCVFKVQGGGEEMYSGTLKKLGLDIGVSEASFMEWTVYTPADKTPGAMALGGAYRGFSAEAALGIGLGANALIGGNGKDIGLQPLRIEAKKGLNLAVGLTELELTPVN